MEHEEEKRRLVLLEKALADYIARYGMTDEARKALVCPQRGQPDTVAHA